VLLVADNAMAKNEDNDSKQIANYEYQINELRKQKEQCYNDLTYEESKQAYE
jgi:formylmethanofuran dehydrogenase subunit E-like metal-binding protein